MIRAAQLIAVAIATLCLLALAPPVSAQKSLVRDDLASAAVRLQADLKTEAGAAATRPADQLRRDSAQALARGDARQALSSAAAAVAADPANAAGWTAYARAAMAILPANYNERYRLAERATSAAYAAYQNARGAAAEASALALLGDVFASRQYWRPSLDAYRMSLALADDSHVRSIYEGLREKYGFRILDYRVDSDSASPRVCFNFSEPLARGRVDFAPFVAVTGSATPAVTGEDRQLCVDGLKHGERYAIVLRQGLPSSVEETLLRNADYEIYVRDRSPQARFTGRNYILPRTGQEGIPVVTVNTDKVDVELYRIGDRNLLPTLRSDEFMSQIARYTADNIASDQGQKVWAGTLDVARRTNEDVTTAFPVLEATGGKLEPGVYVMTARPSGGPPADEDYSPAATQWFIVSDIGLTALSGEDGVHVVARSLASAGPLAGATVKLVARNNEVLGEVKSDGNGRAVFAPGLSRGKGGLAPGLVVATTEAGDYAFLDLAQTPFDLTDRGVAGRQTPGPLDAQVFTERGVYRTGETVQVTALLRDARGDAAAGLPLTLVARRPDGVEYRRVAVDDQGLGGRAWSLAILPGAMRGTWRLTAYADPKGAAIGETTFLVEDYVPERLELTLAPQAPTVAAGDAANIDVTARYLYGAPGAELEVSGSVTIEVVPNNAVPGLEGYAVGLDDEAFETVMQEVEEGVETDAAGKAVFAVPLPEVSAPRPLQAIVTVTVAEPGGRGVARSLTLPVAQAGNVIGVRKLFTDLSDGGIATFDVVAATGEGKRLAMPLRWSLYRIDQHYQWFNQGGGWSYEPIKTTRRIADGEIEPGTDAPARISAPVGWGRYRLEIEAGRGEAAPTSLSFSVGYSGSVSADTPDVLDMRLDKASYAAGETMAISLKPRAAGKATVLVVGDKVHWEKLVDLDPAGTTVSLEAKAEWGPGAYVVVLAHRPLDVGAKRMPGRALGLAWFSVARDQRDIDVSLDVPQVMQPRQTLEVPVRLGGLAAGEEAYVTVAAVDVGILNLTRYEAPRPGDYFFGQRRLGTEIRDVYGYLIDGMQGTRGAIRSGGDAGAPQLDGAPPTQEPVALYSGVVRAGADGVAHVSFDMPAFNGTVRVMAVAWSKTRAGSATADVVVRDPVVVSGTLPRFLNVGDTSRIHLAIDNLEGEAGDYVIEVDASGPVILPLEATRRTLKLEKGARTALSLPVTAGGLGVAKLTARLTGPRIDVAQDFALGIAPGTPALAHRTVRPLPAGGSVSISSDILAGLMPGSGVASVSVTTLAALDVPGLLQALDRYPYGCSEQIVSRALPLLYVNELASTEALPVDTQLDERVRGAVERVMSRQDSNGSFGLWSVGGDDIWLDAYVTDFLTRAREKGFAVPQTAFDLALERLRNYVANTTEFDQGQGQTLAYAIYVLARNGRPVMGDLRYLADVRLPRFGSAMAQAQIAAALALLGDRRRAETAFATAMSTLRGEKDGPASRPDYGSRLRDGAAVLALLGEAGTGGAEIQQASLVIDEARGTSRYTSTQEQAWLVLAAGALARDNARLRLTVDGREADGPFYRNYRAARLDEGAVTIANTGTLDARVVVTAAGNPTAREGALARGYTVERSYYRLDGTAVDPATVRQNERLVTMLKVTENQARFARLLVVDHLPAGFEIDNPNLVDASSAAALSWLQTTVEPAHVEYRDDRFVAAFDRDSGQSAFITVAYMIRAVAPGRYVHPPATAEDMYRPERFGRTGFGTVEVTEAK
ncbi:alpha-2-macroglobulin family protein [Chelatococcus daeguensis]|uniref:alpha-2-macroglobulin family protein n=1 Tax=Chelatococcus daeguensis TaxID=444444 RepID=UPI0007ABF31F|nr:alpha-2-macroglobulin [Chelatococcus daeguensis]KZE36713.1 alpha-2-macroglobulin [Chelatococcus daeguensis]MBM3082344.1 alpha-2-macroglobulin family protein [Chelatococcus daeguensis]